MILQRDNNNNYNIYRKLGHFIPPSVKNVLWRECQERRNIVEGETRNSGKKLTSRHLHYEQEKGPHEWKSPTGELSERHSRIHVAPYLRMRAEHVGQHRHRQTDSWRCQQHTRWMSCFRAVCVVVVDVVDVDDDAECVSDITVQRRRNELRQHTFPEGRWTHFFECFHLLLFLSTFKTEIESGDKDIWTGEGHFKQQDLSRPGFSSGSFEYPEKKRKMIISTTSNYSRETF